MSRSTIDANVIDVALQGRLMKASGGVKTTLRRASQIGQDCPACCKQDQPANVNANALDYQGASGQAVYTGTATMWQGETAIRADSIAIDQSKGDFVALGNAGSTHRAGYGGLDCSCGGDSLRGHGAHDCVRIDRGMRSAPSRSRRR